MANKPKKFIQDDSMDDSEKLMFAYDFLKDRFEATRTYGRPSTRITVEFPTIEEVFDLARKL